MPYTYKVAKTVLWSSWASVARSLCYRWTTCTFSTVLLYTRR